jgi:Flp pilus assembly protein TadG
MFHDRKGAIAVMFAIAFPALLGVGLLSVDGARLFLHHLILRQTVEAAALAAANRLNAYYNSPTADMSAVTGTATQFGALNMPAAKYGTVVAAADVILGNWDAATASFTALVQGGAGLPNAVSVTGRTTTANGNPVQLAFGGIYGHSSLDATKTVIATSGSVRSFHTMIVNELSRSVSSSGANQRAADQAIFACLSGGAGLSSKFGIVGATSTYTVLQAPITISGNVATIDAAIAAIQSCGGNGQAPCSGSNPAAGLYKASAWLNDPAVTDAPRHIVLVTDDLPNAKKNVNYGREEGTYPSPSALTPVCSDNCSDSDLMTMATNQANYAESTGISISTVFFSQHTPQNQQAAAAATVAGWRRGNGISIVIAGDQPASRAQAVCSTMASRLAKQQ